MEEKNYQIIIFFLLLLVVFFSGVIVFDMNSSLQTVRMIQINSDKNPVIYSLFSISFFNQEKEDETGEKGIDLKEENISRLSINEVKNGDFEKPIIPKSSSFITYYQGDRVNDWIIGEISVDIVQIWKAASGSQSADLNGDTSGLIYQNVTVDRDKQYLLMFQYAGNYGGGDGIKEFQILWGDKIIDTVQLNCTGKSKENMGWERYQKILTPTDSQMYLGFRYITPTKGWGAVIDSVELLQIE